MRWHRGSRRFLGDGPGGLRRAAAAGAGTQRDGTLDLAIANHGVARVTILLGDRRGGFPAAPGSPLAVRSNPQPHAIAACDVHSDGLPDLVIDSRAENRFPRLRGDGEGGAATPGSSIEAGRADEKSFAGRIQGTGGGGAAGSVFRNAKPLPSPARLRCPGERAA